MGRPTLPPHLKAAKAEGRLVSATQLTLYGDGCPRKWGYRYIDGLPDPAGPGAELGTAMHKRLEAYLRDGVKPPLTEKAGALAWALSVYLPKPPLGKGFEVEAPFDFEIEGVVYHGFIDLKMERDTLVLPDGRITQERFAVVDHKSTGNLTYAKTTDDLRSDHQCTLYQEALRRAHPEAPRLEAYWNYAQTRDTDANGNPPTLQSILVSTPDEIRARMARSHRIGLQIVEAHKGPSTALPQNPEYCYAFHKQCVFYSRCQPGSPPKKTIGNIMASSTIERLKARRAAAAAQASQATPEATPKATPKATPEATPVEVFDETALALIEAEAEDEVAPEAEAAPKPSKKADTRTDAEKAPPRKERADKGKTRGPSVPEGFSAELAALITVMGALDGLRDDQSLFVLKAAMALGGWHG